MAYLTKTDLTGIGDALQSTMIQMIDYIQTEKARKRVKALGDRAKILMSDDKLTPQQMVGGLMDLQSEMIAENIKNPKIGTAMQDVMMKGFESSAKIRQSSETSKAYENITKLFNPDLDVDAINKNVSVPWLNLNKAPLIDALMKMQLASQQKESWTLEETGSDQAGRRDVFMKDRISGKFKHPKLELIGTDFNENDESNYTTSFSPIPFKTYLVDPTRRNINSSSIVTTSRDDIYQFQNTPRNLIGPNGEQVSVLGGDIKGLKEYLEKGYVVGTSVNMSDKITINKWTGDPYVVPPKTKSKIKVENKKLTMPKVGF